MWIQGSISYFFPLCLRVLALQDTLIFKERLTHHFAPITHVTALK